VPAKLCLRLLRPYQSRVSVVISSSTFKAAAARLPLLPFQYRVLHHMPVLTQAHTHSSSSFHSPRGRNGVQNCVVSCDHGWWHVLQWPTLNLLVHATKTVGAAPRTAPQAPATGARCIQHGTAARMAQRCWSGRLLQSSAAQQPQPLGTNSAHAATLHTLHESTLTPLQAPFQSSTSARFSLSSAQQSTCATALCPQCPASWWSSSSNMHMQSGTTTHAVACLDCP